ncbi:hypothetical protein WJX72_002873 [[Myrmecia] bisecta]|uniref:Uncharacterized protein n=1 Tax=[Myrmecia] bisecta TaxID=41462 RepID=A0AAW1Q0M5_9CHLO
MQLQPRRRFLYPGAATPLSSQAQDNPHLLGLPDELLQVIVAALPQHALPVAVSSINTHPKAMTALTPAAASFALLGVSRKLASLTICRNLGSNVPLHALCMCAAAVPGSWSMLTTLSITDVYAHKATYVTDASLKQLSSLQSLTHLENFTFPVPDESRITDNGLQYLTALPKLRHLDLSRNDWLTDVGVGHIAQLVHLTGLILAKSMDLCSLVTMTSLRSLALVAHAEPLRRGSSEERELPGLSSLSHLAQLTGLSMLLHAYRTNRAQLWADAGLLGLRSLQSLELSWNPLGGLTEQDMAKLACLTGLQRLNLCQRLHAQQVCQ